VQGGAAFKVDGGTGEVVGGGGVGVWDWASTTWMDRFLSMLIKLIAVAKFPFFCCIIILYFCTAP